MTQTYLFAGDRHHRCEVCKEIFACHLCRPSSDHRLHNVAKSELSGRTYYVCLGCILSDPERNLAVRHADSRYRRHLYNHITGELVGYNLSMEELTKFGPVRVS